MMASLGRVVFLLVVDVSNEMTALSIFLFR